MSDDWAAQVAGVGALAEPARRALYAYVVAQSAAVSREQAADAVDLPLHSVKFHLDRLVEKGLLDVEFRRLSGRTGPGAGRPSKLYRRSPREVSVSLPARRYDLAGQILATAIDRCAQDTRPIDQAVQDAARAEGRRIASHSDDAPEAVIGLEAVAPPSAAPVAAVSELQRIGSLLTRYGFGPKVSGQELCLTNCPFDRLAAGHTELVCGMNLALIDGVLDGLRIRDLTPRLAPQPGFCCVRVGP